MKSSKRFIFLIFRRTRAWKYKIPGIDEKQHHII
jgi:hypothetical protein